MKNYYNLDGIKTMLRKEIAKNETLLEEWKKVKFVTKKDGTPFANMSRNFENAKYHKNDYVLQDGEYTLSVGGFCKLNGYVKDEILCYQLVKYLTDEAMILKTQNYMPKQSYLEQVYCYDLNDIKKAVFDRIDHLEKRIITLNNELGIVEKCFNDFVKAYSESVKTLECACAEAGTVGFSGTRNDIYYAILDTVQNNYTYR